MRTPRCRAGGEVIGVIPEALALSEIAHEGLTQLYIVSTMHERKALMNELSDAFIALPGAFGTMDEFCEVLSWRQLSIHDKPIGLLNYRGFYDALLALFDSMVAEGFLGSAARSLFVVRPPRSTNCSPKWARRSLRKRRRDDSLLLDGVLTRITLARAGPIAASDILDVESVTLAFEQASPHEGPRPHILRLLLNPDDLLEPRIARDHAIDLADR